MPETVQILYQRPNVPDVQQTVKSTYTSNHLPDIIKKHVGTDFEVWQDNIYDNCGNLTNKKITKPSSEILREMSYLYDLKKRFVTRTTNSLNHKEQFVYDNKTGQLIRHISSQNIISTNTYDAFGRLTSSSGPNGTTTYTYNWSSDSYIVDDFININKVSEDNSWECTFYDTFGRKVHQRNSSMDDNPSNISYKYNSWSKLDWVSESFKYTDSEPTKYVNYIYDEFGRLTETSSYKHHTILSYSEPRKITSTNNLATSQTQWILKNSQGEVIQSNDPYGDLLYTYSAAGQPRFIESPGGFIYEMKYDNAGNKTKLIDPNAGEISYEYDLLGQLEKQTDAEGNVIDYTYDEIGRLKTETNPNFGVNTYTYVESGNGLGNLESVSNNLTNISKSYIYNDKHQVESISETIDGTTFQFYFTYDVLNRFAKLDYPEGFSINYIYGDYGNLIGINDGDDQMIWEIKKMTSQGKLEEIDFGNNTNTKYEFDGYKQLSGIETKYNSSTIVQNLGYSFEYQTGNLLSRSDYLANAGAGVTESFTYDNDRLETYQVGTNDPISLVYKLDGSGRIDTKSDVGTYIFGDAAGNIPHAVTSITESDGTNIHQVPQSISYTAFNKVSQIIEDNIQLDITYGPNNDRKITELQENGNVKKKKTFIQGLYEIEEDDVGNKRHLFYVPGPIGIAAIYEKINTQAGEFFYIHKDHQGSFQTITNENGTVEQKLSFDPWGRRRNPNDWSYNSVPSTFIFDRGYTGHEHLDAFDLINMNGRVFDPVICQFLSPDKYVQNPINTQSFNRYSYGLNNPLRYTDPSGFIRQTYDGTWDDYPYTDAYGMPSPAINGGYYFGGPVAGLGWPDHQWNFDFYGLSGVVTDEMLMARNNQEWALGRAQRNGAAVQDFMGNWYILDSDDTYTVFDTRREDELFGFQQDPNGSLSINGIINCSGFNIIIGYNGKNLVTGDINVKYPVGGGGGLNTANNIAGGIGVLGTGLGMVNGTFRLSKSGSFSPGYYASGWSTGNQYVKNLYSVSKVGNGVSAGANVVTTGIAYYQIANGTQQPITYVDAGVGTMGIIASGASYFYGVQIPVVGEFVAVYGVVRVTWDVFFNLGANYGPSKWYGTDDTRWFK